MHCLPFTWWRKTHFSTPSLYRTRHLSESIIVKFVEINYYWMEISYLCYNQNYVKRYVLNLIWRGILFVWPLKALYTLLPDRPVHSNTNPTSLGSIQPSWNYCAKLFSHIFTPLALIYIAEWTGAPWREWKCPCMETAAKEIWTRAPSIESQAFYSWATALHSSIQYRHIWICKLGIAC